MSVLWSLVTLLSIYIGCLHDVSGQLLPTSLFKALPNVPSDTIVPKIPLNGPGLPLRLPHIPGIPSLPRKNSPKDHHHETNEGQCGISANYFLGIKHINEYMNKSLPDIFVKMVQCADFQPSGALSQILETVNISDMLEVTNLLNSLEGGSSPLSLLGGSSLPLSLLGGGASPLDFLGGNTSPLSALGGVSSPLSLLGAGASPLDFLGGNSSPLSALGRGSSPLSALGRGSSPLSARGSNASPFDLLGGGPLPLSALGGYSSPLSRVANVLPISDPLKNLPPSLPSGSLGSLPTSSNFVPSANLPPFEKLSSFNNLLNNAKKPPSDLEGIKSLLRERNPLASGRKNSEGSQGENAGNKIKDTASSATKEVSEVELLGNTKKMVQSTGSIKFHATDVQVTNVTLKVDGDKILATGDAKALIVGSDNLEGVVADALAFDIGVQIQLTIIVNETNSQCISFDIQDKKINMTRISMKTLDRVTKQVKPVEAIELSSVVTSLFTIDMSSEEGQCNVAFDNPNCKNATEASKDLFKYNVKETNFSPKGLVIGYCTSVINKDKSVPVPGDHLPPVPDGVDIALDISHTIIKTIITHIGMHTSVKINDRELTMKTLIYKLTKDKLRIITNAEVLQNGLKIASVKTVIILSHKCKISNGNLKSELNLVSFEHSIDPAEMTEDVKEMGDKMVIKMLTYANEVMKNVNLPEGPLFKNLEETPFVTDSQGNIIASK